MIGRIVDTNTNNIKMTFIAEWAIMKKRKIKHGCGNEIYCRGISNTPRICFYVLKIYPLLRSISALFNKNNSFYYLFHVLQNIIVVFNVINNCGGLFGVIAVSIMDTNTASASIVDKRIGCEINPGLIAPQPFFCALEKT